MSETLLLHPDAPQFDGGEAFNLNDLAITSFAEGGVALGGLSADSILTDPTREVTTKLAAQDPTLSYSCPGGGHTCDNCTEAEGCKY